MTTALEMRNITKQFPGVKALDDVTFTVKKGRSMRYVVRMVQGNRL